MRKWKQGLASLLAVMMLVSALPATALAAEEETGQQEPILTLEEPTVEGSTPAEEEPTVEGDTPAEEEPTVEEDTPAEEEPTVEEDTSAEEEVVYNLLNCPVTVGSDETRAEEYAYALFDEEGNYTIPLEDNAFFPYEVQFTYDGETWTEWFMDPADTVDVGGHEFSVASEQTDPSVLTQIGVTVGGEYIPAYPEEKEFSDLPSITPASLLPLPEEYVSLDMRGYFAEELKEVEVTTVLAGEATLEADDLVVWAKEYDSDDFSIMGADGTLDLSPSDSYNNYVYFDLIVGNADQLDMENNTLYNVTVEVSPEYDLLTGSAYTADGQEIPLLDDPYYSPVWMTYADGREFARLRMEVSTDDNIWDGQSEAKVKLAKGTSDFSDLAMEVYTGSYFTLEELDAAVDAGTTQNVTTEIVDGTGYLADYTSDDGCKLTARWLRDGKAIAVRPMYVELSVVGESWSYSGMKDDEGMIVSTWDDSYYDEVQRVSVIEYKAREGYAVDGDYFFSMTYNRNGTQVSDAAEYISAYVGFYRTLEEAAGQTDIAAQLFGTGYKAKYNGDGVTFSIFTKDGSIAFRNKIVLLPYEPEVAEEPEPGQEDTYFHVDGASKQGEPDYAAGEYRAWVMPADVDGYYYGYPDGEMNFGCQTVFLTDGMSDPVVDAEIYPEFTLGAGVKAYAGHNGASGVEQVSRVSSVPFVSGQAVQYSATSGSQTLKNYWVTFVTPQDGAKLYVNAANVQETWDEETGLPVREVYLDSFHDYHHDVFFANIGDEELQGLSVTLENAQNVQLDEYWTIRENSVAKLGAFDSVYNMDNIAKIRLEPIRDENGEVQAGEVSGTLVIKADMGTPADPSDDQEVRIKLVGTAGAEKITTDEIVGGVKYVPYASVIQTNVMGASDAVRFRVVSGSLPEGITLFENGKLYGVPMEMGSFTFTVRADFTRSGRYEEKEFTLEILTNSDTNVEGSTDMGYELLDRVPAELTSYEDQVFRSQGTYGEFCKFYLDGRELVEGEDFKSEEGSTKITIYAQTFRDAGRGTHTIAAEFRTDKSDTNTVKKAAQNYRVSGGSSGGSGSSKPETKPQVPATAADIFRDISANDWFYSDVNWAYQNKLMIGVTSNTYVPYGLISPATAVTVLARMDQVDLDDYAAASYPQIDAGQWYTNAANWAMESGLLTDEHFTGQPPIARAKLAVMLVKYLRHSGVDCTLTGDPVVFADASLMTQEENDAFQVLYQFGIFKGVGNYYMDPQGSTTRAQLAVLLHRLSVFVGDQTV